MAAALPAGQQGSQQQVPWAQVGPGWILAEWSPTLDPSAAMSLFLIDPAGGRYLMDTCPADPAHSAPTSLLAWSGDGQRALLTNYSASATVAVLNLRTLATTQFQLQNSFPVGFTRPAGEAILVSVNGNGSGQSKLERVSLTGQLELSYPTSSSPGNVTNGSALYSPDGTELAVGTCHVVIASASCAAALTGVELVSNAGQPIRFLPVIPSDSGCSPLRWWAPQELLVDCAPNGTNAGQDWLVPTSGATPKALTASPPAPSDLGDGNAWQIPSGIHVQDAGACSYTYVAKLQPNGLTAPSPYPAYRAARAPSSLVRWATASRSEMCQGVRRRAPTGRA
jgi:TolB protein